ncbi:GNAT family N-acetyltransferase [Tropicibacter oceani]|uniref:GNAT family N-acetyltransferase n=1 Tax=Tropicibacter oceani TaxID=3058420 RepID=A0ABY8QPC8_9RHOB|nr:GNAT family N-acetyltransferase [Tropicibacter oceani]WGW05901.1 GNAT family N-acetyltransferase [Tropicibacter oceani]
MSTVITLSTSADPAVEAILVRHHSAMSAATPAESCHVMTSDALRASGARVYALRDGSGAVQGVGALKPFGQNAVELKSMHVAAEARGKGFGKSLLNHLLSEARAMGMTAAYLETGSEPGFAPARALYEAAGFEYGPPFGDYVPDRLSVFMSRRL